jgi:hypothetical protein
VCVNGLHLVRFEQFANCRLGVVPDAPERAMALIRDFIWRCWINCLARCLNSSQHPLGVKAQCTVKPAPEGAGSGSVGKSES